MTPQTDSPVSDRFRTAARAAPDNKIAALAGLSLAVFIFIGIVSYRSLTNLHDADSWVEHTQQVEANIERTVSQIKDAFLGTRGYVITGDERFLEPYQNSVPTIAGLIRDLRNLTEDNPAQQSRVDRIEELATRQGKEMARIIEARRTRGFDAARQMIAVGESKRLMDEIRVLGNEMISEENRLLAIRQTVLHTEEQTTRRIILFGGIADCLMIGLAFFLVLRSNAAIRTLSREVNARAIQLEAANKELEKARDVAEESTRAKSRFLASMSHELRTPLNAILGYSEILMEEAEEHGMKECRSDLQKIHGAGKHLLALINDILDISKVEAGKMQFHFETFDVAAILRNIPVIVVTSKDLTEPERRALNDHAQKIMQKGEYTKDDLLAEIKRVIGKR